MSQQTPSSGPASNVRGIEMKPQPVDSPAAAGPAAPTTDFTRWLGLGVVAGLVVYGMLRQQRRYNRLGDRRR
jgi:hypothetical protein